DHPVARTRRGPPLQDHPPCQEGGRTMRTTPPLAVVESSLPNAGKRRRGERATRIRGSRPGFWVYLTLVVVFVSAAFPLYWSFVIGSGDASSLRERPWWPGGNFLDNAFAVVSNPAVNFWPALWNSIYSSFLIAAAVVITSTLAGWAFAKLRFL